MIYFTSDTHFGHSNILKHCNRPFSSIVDHDEELIRRWNAKVTPEDEVYHLGDFSFASPERTKRILNRLHGKKYLIQGNHDKGIRGTVTSSFVWVKDYFELRSHTAGGEQRIILFHYPIQNWNGAYRGSWHLHGHSHGNTPSPGSMLRLDVGVDVHRFSPISVEEIRILFRDKSRVDDRGTREASLEMLSSASD